MEILIPGIILVALMAYASTRIKKRAAEAYEAETIETEDYSLRKPEGFLHILDSPNHAVEAYSREYGEDDAAARLRRATIELDIFEGGSFGDICDSVRQSAESYEDRTPGAKNIRVIAAEESANETPIKALYKIVEGDGAIYRLRVSVLSEHSDEYLRKIEEALDSFILK